MRLPSIINTKSSSIKSLSGNGKVRSLMGNSGKVRPLGGC